LTCYVEAERGDMVRLETQTTPKRTKKEKERGGVVVTDGYRVSSYA
jgi:hypothetical protein